MAFMVPLVKNHYDIYARNNPADHCSDTNSLYLSATSLKSGAPVKKQYRIILTGGKVVNGGGGSKKSSANSAASLTQTPNGKLYYRLPSASISLPVRPMATKGRASGALKKSAGGGGGSPGKSTSADNSPTSATSPSRPLPHVRRTVRNPMTNRVYSYSVSIPDYVAEEPEDLMHHESLLDPENKENGLPGSPGTPDSTTASPTPPPILPASKKVKKQPVTASVSLPPGKVATKPPPVVRQTSLKTTHARTHSSTSTGSSGPETPSSNSREYIELLRKFILHLKMLKIGGGSGSSKKASLKTSATKECSAVPAVVPVAVLTPENAPPPEATPTTEPSTEQPRARKRKDTMEDSKHL